MINSTTRHSKLYRDFIFTNFFNKFIYENDNIKQSLLFHYMLKSDPSISIKSIHQHNILKSDDSFNKLSSILKKVDLQKLVEFKQNTNIENTVKEFLYLRDKFSSDYDDIHQEYGLGQIKVSSRLLKLYKEYLIFSVQLIDEIPISESQKRKSLLKKALDNFVSDGSINQYFLENEFFSEEQFYNQLDNNSIYKTFSEAKMYFNFKVKTIFDLFFYTEDHRILEQLNSLKESHPLHYAQAWQRGISLLNSSVSILENTSEKFNPGDVFRNYLPTMKEKLKVFNLIEKDNDLLININAFQFNLLNNYVLSIDQPIFDEDSKNPKNIWTNGVYKNKSVTSLTVKTLTEITENLNIALNNSGIKSTYTVNYIDYGQDSDITITIFNASNLAKDETLTKEALSTIFNFSYREEINMGENWGQNNEAYEENLNKISMRVFQNFNENLLPLVNKVLMYNELNNNPIISSGFKKHKIRKF